MFIITEILFMGGETLQKNNLGLLTEEEILSTENYEKKQALLNLDTGIIFFELNDEPGRTFILDGPTDPVSFETPFMDLVDQLEKRGKIL